MATETSPHEHPQDDLSGNATRDIPILHANILAALNTLIQRATATDVPVVTDERVEDGVSKGVLMDCEFGLLVTVARAILPTASLTGPLGDTGIVSKLTVALIKSALTKMSRRDEYQGGTPTSATFCFAAEPYTPHKVLSTKVFSAHLDAAMLVVGFLVAALPQYDEPLRQQGTCPDDVNHELLARHERRALSLRDAGLLACLEGLDYALACRVESNGLFQGFTCDPITNAEATNDPEHRPGGLSDFDRLFFTWTTTETIDEMRRNDEWKSYLSHLTQRAPDPAQTLATRIESRIKELEKVLAPASQWCERTFGEGLKSFKLASPRPLVDRFQALDPKQKVIPADLHRDVLALGTQVQYVYHLSQYAAIRSIASTDVRLTLDEVRAVSDALDDLVSKGLLQSGLDGDKHPPLYRTLTRAYKLGFKADEGKWDTQEPYVDDAYFPLVVRALAGLLTRALDGLAAGGASRKDLRELIGDFRKALARLTSEALRRRPAGAANQSLWSYLPGGPYVLYATERTVFALIAYQEFLERMALYASESEGAGGAVALPGATLQAELIGHIGQKLAPFLEEFFATRALSTAAPMPAAATSTGGMADPVSTMLPKEPWARETLIEWLTGFCKCLEANSVREELDIWAKKLTDLHEAKVSDQIWKPVRADMPRLASAIRFDHDEMRRILLYNLIHKYAQLACSPADSESTPDAAELISPQDKPWSTIAGALTSNDSARRSMRQSKS